MTLWQSFRVTIACNLFILAASIFPKGRVGDLFEECWQAQAALAKAIKALP